MKNKFNKKAYDKKYQKEHREEHKGETKQWKVELPTKQKEKYDELLKKVNKTKKEFLIESFKKLEEEM